MEPQRCRTCKRMTPAREMHNDMEQCMRCDRSAPRDNTSKRVRGWQALRATISPLYNQRCVVCDKRENWSTWRLVPVTVEGRRILSDYSLKEVYGMDHETILANFKLVCGYHYQNWLDYEEEASCRLPVILKTNWSTFKVASKKS